MVYFLVSLLLSWCTYVYEDGFVAGVCQNCAQVPGANSEAGGSLDVSIYTGRRTSLRFIGRLKVSASMLACVQLCITNHQDHERQTVSPQLLLRTVSFWYVVEMSMEFST